MIDMGGLEGQVGFHMRVAQAAMLDSFARAFDPLGVKPAHYSALVVIEANPGLIQQALSKAVRVQRANLVRLLDELVLLGWVAREEGSDRRSKALRLTAAGETKMAAIHLAHAEHEARIRAALPDTTALLAGLRRLKDIAS